MQQLERLSRREVARWGRDFDLLLTPTSGDPAAADRRRSSTAQHAAPDQPVFETIASVCFTAFGNITGLPAISLPLHWNDDGHPGRHDAHRRPLRRGDG